MNEIKLKKKTPGHHGIYILKHNLDVIPQLVYIFKGVFSDERGEEYLVGNINEDDGSICPLAEYKKPGMDAYWSEPLRIKAGNKILVKHKM